MSSPSRSWSFAATRQNVAVARHVVAAYARWHRAAEPLTVALAVSEAFTNAVMHAYPEGCTSGVVQIVAERHSRRIEIRVCDAGRGMEAGPSPPDGMGLSMIRQVAERVEIESRSGGGTQIAMSFPLA